MTSLVEFLTARIAEDEATARAAGPAPWGYGDIESVAGGTIYDAHQAIAGIEWDNESPEPIRRMLPEWQADANGMHIVRWDPWRVLAECEAKRRIIADCIEFDDESTSGAALGHRVLRHLGALHADHTDYQQEWR